MNALDSLIAVLSTPVAKRQGVTISAEDCKIWVEELKKYEEGIRKCLMVQLKQSLDLLKLI
jgi:hypothetical protein